MIISDDFRGMGSLCETLEAFCLKSKIEAIWKRNPTPYDDIMRKLHAEAAVFNAIYRCKTSTAPSYEKIIQTIKFLEENDFWRTNSLSMFANHKDQNVLRTVKILQSQEIRDLWKCSGARKNDSTFKSEQIKQTTLVKSSTSQKASKENRTIIFYNNFVQQRPSPSFGHEKSHQLFGIQPNSTQTSSKISFNRLWMSANDLQILQQQSIQTPRSHVPP